MIATTLKPKQHMMKSISLKYQSVWWQCSMKKERFIFMASFYLSSPIYKLCYNFNSHG